MIIDRAYAMTQSPPQHCDNNLCHVLWLCILRHDLTVFAELLANIALVSIRIVGLRIRPGKYAEPSTRPLQGTANMAPPTTTICAETNAVSTSSICLHGQDPGVTAVMYVPLHTLASHQHLEHHAQQLTMSSVQVSQGAYNHYVRSAGHNMLWAVSVQAQLATVPASHSQWLLHMPTSPDLWEDVK